MTESKPPAQGRIIRQTPGSNLSIVTTPTVSGHAYLSGSPFQQSYVAGRGKVQPAASTTTVTGVQHSVKMNPMTPHFQVPLQLGPTKTPLTVVTTYSVKPDAGGQPTTRTHPNLTNINKLTTINPVSCESSHIRPNIKAVGIQKVSYVKQSMSSTIPGSSKPTITTVPNQIVAGHKVQETGKPVLIGQGLRQPSGHFQHQVSQSSIPFSDTTSSAGISRAPSVNSTSWVVHQQDPSRVALSNATGTTQRTKTPVVVRSLYSVDSSGVQLPQTSVPTHDLSKKHTSVVHQPKTTISISMPTLSQIPQSELGHRSAVVKPVCLAPFQTPIANSVKKLQTMIVTQVPNSSSVNTVFTQANNSSGQITMMTCSAGVTFVPAPTPLSVASVTSIPIAKVYPQQQTVSRLSVSVPVASSIPSSNSINAGVTKNAPTFLQIGAPRTNAATSTVMTTHTTFVSTIPPVAINKPIPNPSVPNPLLLWSSYSPHGLPLSANPTVSGLRVVPATTQQSSSAPGAMRVQSHNVLVVDTQRNSQLTTTTPTNTAGSDAGRANSSLNSSGSAGAGPTTPTMSPKPAILRRQRPDSSMALKKLSFPTAGPAGFTNQRRDTYNTQLKQADRRSAPYHTNRHRVTSSKPDTKSNEIAVMIQTSSHLNDKNEVKPVLQNQLFDQIVTSNGYGPLKVSNAKSTAIQFPTGKDTGIQPGPLHSVSIDLKVKMEPGTQNYHQHLNSVKTDSASVSQILHHQYQNPSMHSYAAENSQSMPTIQHRIVTQASGQHIKTNTIFANPTPFGQQRHTGPPNGRVKNANVIKSTTFPPANPPRMVSVPQPVYLSQSGITPSNSPGINSFSHPRHLLRPGENIGDRLSSAFDQVKKEQHTHHKLPAGLQIKTTNQSPATQVNHSPQNQVIATVPQSQQWVHINNSDPLAGLSPRKRPRKQTHIVTDVPQDVEMMEDEESTDDADECEDEPMVDVMSGPQELAATPTSKLPGNKPSPLHAVKSEPDISNKKVIKDEAKPSVVKSEVSTPPSTVDSKPPSEYTDSTGVRYVLLRKRPAVSVLNKLKPNCRSIANHFMRYSDIKVKDKKVAIRDLVNNKNELTGYKVARLALQLRDMIESENEVCQRMRAVYDGLVKHKQSLLGDGVFDDLIAPPTPNTPTSMTLPFGKTITTPGSARRSSVSGILENGPRGSPSTPLDRKATRVKDEITKIEELAQANLQRCRVMSDQMLDTKTMLLKSVDHRPLAYAILEARSEQKKMQSTSTSTNASKRTSKKKSNS